MEWTPPLQIPHETPILAKQVSASKMIVKLRRPDGVIVYGLYSLSGEYQNEVYTSLDAIPKKFCAN